MTQSALDGLDVWLVSGGFQSNYERGFANGLAAAGARVTLIGSDQTDAAGLNPAVRLLNLRGSQRPDRPVWVKALNLLRYHLQLWTRVALARPQVVHVFGLLEPPLLAGVLQGAWLRLMVRRYVLTVHNLLPHDNHTAASRRWYGRACRMAQCCVVHTARMAAELCTMHGVRPADVVVMEHGIEPLDDISPHARAPAPADTVRLLFFGVVARYKGLDLLIDAMRELPGTFTLSVAGFCRDAAYRQELQRLLQGHPAAARIRWEDGWVSEQQVPELFAEADVLVLPYRHIDQSGALFQALRHGVPVVASRVGSFEDYVLPECGLTYDPAQAGALDATLRQFAEVRADFRSAQIVDCARRFEWPRTVAALGSAYFENAARHQSGGESGEP